MQILFKRLLNTSKTINYTITILLSLLLFLLAIDMVGASFTRLGKSTAESILFATSNPFIGLFIGLLITAIIQSSSTSTAMIVAIVSAGSITIRDAVPMIMGANVGTTLTSTIVALGYITNKSQFKRALAAGTIHDFFNILTVLILFPLEYYYGIISSLAIEISGFFTGPGSGADEAVGFKLFDAIPVTDYLINLIGNVYVNILLSFVLLFIAIKILSKQLSQMIIAKANLEQIIFNNAYKSFGIGAGLTAAIQSSSITTSVVVPFVATGRVKLKNALPFILGANIGTTITAFIAVLFKSNAAMSIAMTHLLFNILGVIIFLPFPAIRKLIISLANKFGSYTFKHRLIGFAYIIMTFFLIPFALIYFNKSNTTITELTYLHNGREQVIISKGVPRKRNTLFRDNQESGSGNIDDKVLYVTERNDIIFFNNDFFMLKDVGYCWDNENRRGKYKMCIDSILSSYPINETIEIDSIYVYELTYYDMSPLDSLRQKYYISASDHVLVKSLTLTPSDSVISEKHLIDLKLKY